MAASEIIINTVHSLQKRAAAGELTHQEFQLGMQVLLSAASDVRQLEGSIIPESLRLDPKEIEDAGDNVILFKRPKAAS